jgi:cytochrome c-type biogenesis protein CcmE
MSGSRKRQTRMFVALAAAALLAAVLVWTSFTASSQAVTPSTLVRTGEDGRSYQLTGRVLPGYERAGGVLVFRVRDRSGSASIPVRYRGAVPDPFRAGREIIVTVRRQDGVWVGERDSLVTKCPSKFSAQDDDST